MMRVEIYETFLKTEKTEKISETKTLFFGEKNDKIDKSLARLSKKKDKTQINNIRNETEICDITIDPPGIKIIVRAYYTHRFDNLDNINQSPKKHHQSQPPQYKIDIMNSTVPSKEIGCVIFKIQKKKSPGSDCFTRKFYQTLKKELSPITMYFFPYNRKGRTLSNNFGKPILS